MTLQQKSIHVVGIGGTLRDGSTSLRALELGLQAAESAGATTELIDLNVYRLPMYEPDRPASEYDETTKAYLDIVARADAMLWSTAAYHGTIAGVTKNALDYLEHFSGGPNPYLSNIVVGLIVTSGGAQAMMNTVNAMVHTVHALRGIVTPLSVPIPGAKKLFDANGSLSDAEIADRLNKLGALVVETATRLRTPVPDVTGL
ncbi:MAG: NADPH-dependent oxidoreductase [Chloroflexi bacterium]|nr:MAG: NADPH-dependent oxidoreductase [Chloroflexota bacterium]